MSRIASHAIAVATIDNNLTRLHTDLENFKGREKDYEAFADGQYRIIELQIAALADLGEELLADNWLRTLSYGVKVAEWAPDKLNELHNQLDMAEQVEMRELA